MTFKILLNLTNYRRFTQLNIRNFGEKQVDLFALFDLKRSYRLDLQTLNKAYRAKQMIYHPDRQSANKKNFNEVTGSESHSADLNVAYEILSDPLKRGFHLLSLCKVQITKDFEQTPTDLLEKLMELNERIENAQSEHDIKQLVEELRSHQVKLMEHFEISYDKKNYTEALRALREAKFYQSAIDRALNIDI